MLVLLRKVGETIVIGGRVLVTVLKVRGRSVSLGITAMEGVQVDRKEVWDRKAAKDKEESEGEVPQ
jgi:carbon storage regulator